ncbi:MAG: hypothetical protein HFG49_07365 [Lachnospiraceae bacterium]|nr:hypothetical protein [Lachnospiraceae bacterium]
MIHILHGAIIWDIFRLRFQIDKNKVVLVLVNDNEKLDHYALVHLKHYMERKYAKEAIVLFDDRSVYQRAVRINQSVPVRFCRWDKKKIKWLYDYYSFYNFSDKIVFTYTDCPKDNRLGKLLRETQVQEEEAVCLGLYRLRMVPNRKH